MKKTDKDHVRLITIILFMLSLNVFGKTNFQKQVDVIEKGVLEEIQKQTKGKMSEERRFHLYILAAKEYQQISYDEKAIEYFEKAFKSKVSNNKFEVLTNLIALHWQDKAKVKIYLKDLEKEWKKKPGLAKFEPYVTGVKSYVNGKKLAKDHAWTKGIYAYTFLEDNFQQLIEEKQFKIALAQINPKSLDNPNGNSGAVYDLLQSLVYKHGKKLSHCVQLLKKYPKASGYTAQICRVVIAYQKSDKAGLEQAKKKAIEVINKRKKYNKEHLIVAVSELSL